MKRFWGVLLALAAVRLALMALTPVFDPSEARYAAISANMARTGDYVVPRFTYKGVYQSFDGKPPLVFQAGGLFCKAFGVTEFAVRLFPFLSAALLLAVLYGAVKRSSGAETARLATVVCASSTAFYASAGFAMTDMTLACSVAGALLVYGSVAEGRPRSEWARLAAAAAIGGLLGAGMVTKGPVALALFGLPVVADAVVNRRARVLLDARWLVAAAVFLAVAVPWFVLVEQRNPGSVRYFFYNENFLRFVSHDYGDKYGAGREAFRGVAVVWLFVSCLPWALLAPLRRPAARDFAFVAVAAMTGFWCLTSRVLVYYLFPAIPLFAAYLAKHGDRERLERFAIPCAALSAAVVAVSLACGTVFSGKMQGAKTPYRTHGSSYAYEFYHGTHPDALKNADSRGLK